MKSIRLTTSEELRSENITTNVYWNCKKTLTSPSSFENSGIKIERSYDQLEITTNYPTIYETYQTNDLRGVALIKWSGTDKLKNFTRYMCGMFWLIIQFYQCCFWHIFVKKNNIWIKISFSVFIFIKKVKISPYFNLHIVNQSSVHVTLIDSLKNAIDRFN